jgi:DNA modification methylase
MGGHDVIKPYYSRNGIDLYLGDCREILPQLTEKVDLVLTDPPYGINILNSNGTMGGTSKDLKRWRGQINKKYIPFQNDDKPIDPLPLLAVSKNQIIWGGNYVANVLPVSKSWFVWYKRINGQTNDFGDCELAWTSLDKPPKVFQHLWMGMLRDSENQLHYHPTQKPVALMSWCLSFTPDAQTILDPFLGSGTTAVAAKKLGRRCIGIEISQTYLDIAVQRLQQDTLPLEVEHIQKRQSVGEQPMFSSMATPTKSDKVTGKMSALNVNKEANG